MGRPPLRNEQVAEFRARLVTEALRLFAERGYGALTFRRLGQALGCSAAAPYRYFSGKRGIFSAVRARGFDLFAEAQRSLLDDRIEPGEQLRRLARGYLQFALREPHAFRVMFELAGPHTRATEEERTAERRVWEMLEGAVRRAAEAGGIGGEQGTQAHVFWASVHGVASLHLSGRLLLGVPADALLESAVDALLVGAKAARGRPRTPRRRKEPARARREREPGRPRDAEWKVW